MSPEQPPGRRYPVDAWASFVAVNAAFIAVTAVAQWNPQAFGGFLLLCAVVSFRPRLTLLGLAALIGPLVGLFSWPQAGWAVGLLLLGPLLVTTVTAAVGAALQLWGKEDTATGRVAAVRVMRPWVQGAVIVGVVVAGMVEGGWFVGGAIEVAALVVPLLAFRRSYHKTTVTTGVAASALTGWSVTPLVLAGVALALALFKLSTGRLPRQWHPLPAPSLWGQPLQAVRCFRCDRRIARSDILGARHVLGSGSGPDLRFRSAFLDLEERLYQSALALGTDATLPAALTVPARVLRGRALSGTARFEHARSTYLEVLSTLRDPDDRMHDYLKLLLAENDLAAGNGGNAVQASTWLATRPEKTCDYFMRQRALRVLIEYELDQGRTDRAASLVDQAMDDLVRNRAVARLMLTSEPHKLVRRIYGNRGSMYIHTLRVDILGRAAAPPKGQTAADGDHRDNWEPEPVAMAMAVARAADDLVELYLSEARATALSDRRGDALPLVARALMELDRTRYLLAAQSSRSSWSKRFRRVLDFALTVAYAEQDHEFVCELLEFARVQTLPAATAEASADLALSTPPVVLVNGRSRLARPGEQHRPAHVSLERAAERSAGLGAWWLSYWDSDDWLYWTLVSPFSETTSGRVAFGANSALRKRLDELERALPALLPGEHPAEADFRIDASPLLTDPKAELDLSTALGDLLLPADLVRAAIRRRAHGHARLPLAIAPVAALGYVPWSILVTVDQPSPDPHRLVDLCDWVLAPSAALVCNAVTRPRTRAPLALAVVDTIDDPELRELPEARRQATALPGSVPVLGGHHWSSTPATLSQVEQALRAIDPDSTVAFMCHAVRGSVDEPSTGGLVLAVERPSHAPGPGSLAPAAAGTTPDRYDVLNPLCIFAMSRRGLTMPAQVLLQACDTSALKDAASGEWLTIAPAFVASGSREVVATVYPLPDLPGIDDQMMRAALDGDSLQDAVGRLQREGLLRWTTGHFTEPSHTPFVWGNAAKLEA